MGDLDRHDIHEIAEAVADAAVNKVLLRLGIDITNADAVDEFRRDMNHTRAWRKSTDTIKRHGLIAAVTTIVAAVVGYGFFLITGGKVP